MMNGVEDVLAAAAYRRKKHDCDDTFLLNEKHIRDFVHKFRADELTPDDAVIVVVNIDDAAVGKRVVETLAPGATWEKVRKEKKVMFAGGLVLRTEVEAVLKALDKDAANRLSDMASLAVVIIDYGVAQVYLAPEL